MVTWCRPSCGNCLTMVYENLAEKTVLTSHQQIASLFLSLCMMTDRRRSNQCHSASFRSDSTLLSLLSLTHFARAFNFLRVTFSSPAPSTLLRPPYFKSYGVKQIPWTFFLRTFSFSESAPPATTTIPTTTTKMSHRKHKGMQNIYTSNNYIFFV